MFVNETIGDGSYLVGICLPDANALGLRDGDEMPPADEVRKTLKKARKNCHQATVVLA